MTEYVYANRHYKIVVNATQTGYFVINKETGVLELEALEYPKCLVYVKGAQEIIESFDTSDLIDIA